jgi:hypothetical protein
MTLINEMIAAQARAVADKMASMDSHQETDFELIGMKAALEAVEKRFSQLSGIWEMPTHKCLAQAAWQAVKGESK